MLGFDMRARVVGVRRYELSVYVIYISGTISCRRCLVRRDIEFVIRCCRIATLNARMKDWASQMVGLFCVCIFLVRRDDLLPRIECHCGPHDLTLCCFRRKV